MSQILYIEAETGEDGGHALSYRELGGRGVQEAEHLLEPFIGELRQMTPDERIRASRYSMNRWERWVYAARYPEEVPTVNGELEWIALTLA